MNKPYIIKNCPALYQIEGMTNECLASDYQCQDCTDCVMKQVVELCNDAIHTEVKLITKSGIYYFAQIILNKLEIEECKSEDTQS